MEELLQILSETQIPFAYHHFAEGESPEQCHLDKMTYIKDLEDSNHFFRLLSSFLVVLHVFLHFK